MEAEAKWLREEMERDAREEGKLWGVWVWRCDDCLVVHVGGASNANEHWSSFE
jgi:hypothetical protein